MKLLNYVGGEWVEGRGDGARLSDPVNGETLATASSEGVDFAAALDFARRTGGPALRALTYGERAALLGRIVETLGQRRDAYFEIARRNSGNTRTDAAIDIDGAIGTVKFYARLGQSLGDARHLVDGGLIRMAKDPAFQALHVGTPRRGVAIHINAFNFPAWGLWEKAAVALLAGVPVLAKPATSTCWLASEMVRDVVEAGILPAGALSLVAGSAGDLLDHVGPQDMIAFTGSAETGALIRGHRAVLANGVRVNIEADSLNATLLGPDVAPGSAEFDLLVKEAGRELTQKAGQKCTAIRRILAPRAVAGQVTEALKARLEKTAYGDPANEAVRMGPLVSKAQQMAALDGFALLGREADLVTGGDAGRPLDADPATGCFVAPTQFRLADGRDGDTVHRHEVFGPAATVIGYDDEEAAFEAIRRGGGSLVASIFSADPDFQARAFLALGASHGRLYCIDAGDAEAATGHGIVMPMCLHGGPGRAGDGAELGGLRGLAFYHQTTALQGPVATLQKLAESGARTG
ncbi:MAG: 3,4-dehydroadipyl-CoA semialdehyde dehydrogenase [Azospirillaceae bacterium]